MLQNSRFGAKSPQQLSFDSMNLKEAAAYLRRSPKIIKALADAGEIPCRRFMNGASTRFTYFFSREALDRWQSGSDD